MVAMTVSWKTVHFLPTVSTSMRETKSVASFVSVHADEPHDTPLTSTKAATPGNCGKAEKEDLREAQKSKSETLDVHRLSTGSNCSNSQGRQKLATSRLKQQQLKPESESKGIKKQMERF